MEVTDSTDLLDSQILGHQTRYLYVSSLPALLGALVVTVLVYWWFQGYVDNRLLTSWAVYMILITLGRLSWVAYYYKIPDAHPDEFWKISFEISVALTGLGLGYMGYFLLTPDSYPHQVAIVVILVGAAAIGVQTLAVSLKAMFSIALLSLLPLMARMFVIGTEATQFVGLMVLLYLIMVIRMIFITNRMHMQSIKLRYENIELLESLKQANVESEQLNLSLKNEIEKYERTQQQLIQAKEDADKANQAKSEFLSSMSHELRTPLNAILGFSQLLGSRDLGQEIDQDVKHISDAGEHLLTLINDVLDLAKIESGGLEIRKEAVSVGETMQYCVEVIKPSATKRKIRIEYAEDDKQDYIVQGDKVRLRQVILSLLSNAVKYNHEQGLVSISTERTDNDQIKISVKDTGPGIDKNRMDRLFRPFERVGIRHNEVVEGAGIGLMISKHLVERMGGQIGVESVPEKGSNFWVTMPFEEVVGEREEPQPEEVQATLPLRHKKQRAEILYIEDNRQNITVMEQIILKYTDCRLRTETTGQGGIAAAESNHPDLILLDISLPDLDGYDVLKHLKSGKSTSDIPVMAVTANAMPCDIEKGNAAGFESYITKPIDVENFIGIIRKRLA